MYVHKTMSNKYLERIMNEKIFNFGLVLAIFCSYRLDAPFGHVKVDKPTLLLLVVY